MRCMRPMCSAAWAPMSHEGAFDVLGLRMSRIFGVHSGSGLSSKVEGKLVGMIAVLLDGVGVRIDIHVLVVDELLARVGLVGVDVDGALAGLRKAGDAEDVAVALGVDVVAGLDGGQSLEGIGIAGLVPDVPERTVFLAEAP